MFLADDSGHCVEGLRPASADSYGIQETETETETGRGLDRCSEFLFAWFPMSRHRLFFLLTSTLILWISGAEAQEVIPPDGNAVPRLLVLTSGQVITGTLMARQDGYDVLKPGGGRVFVASPQIRFEAMDILEAYQKMRRSLPELTPGLHVQLARWCLANQLNEQAKRELLDALHLDPNREEAKQILQMIVRRQQAGRLTDSADSDAAASPAGEELHPAGPSYSLPSAGALPIADARSLGGLSRPVAQTFVRRIQPLLNSRCISCHASGQNRFTLLSTRLGSTPLIAERNLDAVLQQVDLTRPESSPLLRAATEAHGGSRTPVLHGRVGRTQADLLRSWIDSVASEQPGSDTGIASQSAGLPELQGPPESAASPGTGIMVSDGPGRTKPVRSLTQPNSDAASGTESESLTEGAGRTISSAETDARVLREIRFRNRRDAFDPEVFNQKFHFASVPPADKTSGTPVPDRGDR